MHSLFQCDELLKSKIFPRMPGDAKIQNSEVKQLVDILRSKYLQLIFAGVSKMTKYNSETKFRVANFGNKFWHVNKKMLRYRIHPSRPD